MFARMRERFTADARRDNPCELLVLRRGKTFACASTQFNDGPLDQSQWDSSNREYYRKKQQVGSISSDAALHLGPASRAAWSFAWVRGWRQPCLIVALRTQRRNQRASGRTTLSSAVAAPGRNPCARLAGARAMFHHSPPQVPRRDLRRVVRLPAPLAIARCHALPTPVRRAAPEDFRVRADRIRARDAPHCKNTSRGARNGRAWASHRWRLAAIRAGPRRHSS